MSTYYTLLFTFVARL